MRERDKRWLDQAGGRGRDRFQRGLVLAKAAALVARHPIQTITNRWFKRILILDVGSELIATPQNFPTHWARSLLAHLPQRWAFRHIQFPKRTKCWGGKGMPEPAPEKKKNSCSNLFKSVRVGIWIQLIPLDPYYSILLILQIISSNHIYS